VGSESSLVEMAATAEIDGPEVLVVIEHGERVSLA
jgi:hypothetical protein